MLEIFNHVSIIPETVIGSFCQCNGKYKYKDFTSRKVNPISIGINTIPNSKVGQNKSINVGRAHSQQMAAVEHQTLLFTSM